MEKIVQERIYPEVKNYKPPLKLTPLLLIVLIMLIGFAAITVVARTLARYMVPPSNPFDTFANIFPGENGSALGSRGFMCQLTHLTPVLEICSTDLPRGDFSRIDVVISNDRINRITFVIRGNTLRIGDVVKMFGMSNAHTYAGSYYHLESYFFWLGETKVSMLANMGRFPLFLPVQSVSFSLE